MTARHAWSQTRRKLFARAIANNTLMLPRARQRMRRAQRTKEYASRILLKRKPVPSSSEMVSVPPLFLAASVEQQHRQQLSAPQQQVNGAAGPAKDQAECGLRLQAVLGLLLYKYPHSSPPAPTPLHHCSLSLLSFLKVARVREQQGARPRCTTALQPGCPSSFLLFSPAVFISSPPSPLSMGAAERAFVRSVALHHCTTAPSLAGLPFCTVDHVL